MAERIDESAMVLAHELGVEYSDVLYVPERVAGDSHPSFETEPIEVRTYAAGAFRQRNRRDYLLHQRATSLLEARMRAWAGFNASFARYSAVEDRVRAECDSEPCYGRSLFSCHYECIDRLVADAVSTGNGSVTATEP